VNTASCYCGRNFTAEELRAVRRIIADHHDASRARLSRLVCELLDWRRPDGRLKDMSCRVAMLRMQDDGLFVLPPPSRTNGNGKRYRRRTVAAEPELLHVDTPAGRIDGLHLDPVAGRGERSHLWNEYIDRYHYLGYHPLPGAQMRYFARCADGQILALMGFGAAAWKAAPRDRFIGWTPDQRKARLHLVVNNARFLILPWVHSKNLASTLLAKAARRLPADWLDRYGHRPALLETFVETPRFRGTCYRAANWLHVGETTGRGKLDRTHDAALPTKSIWLHPLTPDFRRQLCG
jgi:hypothetical protein